MVRLFLLYVILLSVLYTPLLARTLFGVRILPTFAAQEAVKPDGLLLLWVDLGQDGALDKWRLGEDSFHLLISGMELREPSGLQTDADASIQISWPKQIDRLQSPGTVLWLRFLDQPRNYRTLLLERENSALALALHSESAWYQIALTEKEINEQSVELKIRPLTGGNIVLEAVVLSSDSQNLDSSKHGN